MIGDATTVIVTALADAVRAQGRKISRCLVAALDGRVEPLHLTRVASRRLRESLAVVGAVGIHVETTRVEREARRLTRALGPVREIDVALQQFDLAGRLHRWPMVQRAAVRRALETVRERRRRRMNRSLRHFDRAAFSARCRQAANAIATGTDTRAWWKALSDRVRARAANVTSAIDACGTLYDPERLHTLRIAIKKLRYAIEFAGEIPGVELAPTAAALKHAQDRFGHLHDVQMLKAEVEQLAVSSRRLSSRQVLTTMIDDLERDCRVIHGEILPLLAGLRGSAILVRREVSMRARSRQLSMAKATVDAAVKDEARARDAPKSGGQARAGRGVR